MTASPKIRERGLLAAACACAFAIALAGCSHGSADDQGVNATVNAEVTIAKVVRADISQTILLTGTAAAPPNDDVKVSALVPGRIAELNVAEGDRVHDGQLLAKLDDHSYRDQLRQAEAAGPAPGLCSGASPKVQSQARELTRYRPEVIGGARNEG